ncbi:MAG: glycosyltransferase [Chloroflexota bacterium]
MTDPLRVLLYGDLHGGVSESVRFGAVAPHLAAHGIELRTWESMAPYQLFVPTELASDLDRAVRDGRASVDLAPLLWADVLVFRRWYATAHACLDCDTVTRRAEQLWLHTRSAGHRAAERGLHTRVLLDMLARDPSLLRGTAVLYDTDDDLLGEHAPLNLANRLGAERPDVRRLVAMADLVTVTTPVLAERLAPHARAEVRVVRNAIEPAWYPDAAASGGGHGLRVVYYGSRARQRDYEVARPAVDALAASPPGAQRIWLGAAEDPACASLVDAALPWVEGVEGFGAALAATRPDIGIAPLADDPYNLARSELHWLEYAAIGAPVVASAFAAPGPYDPIRDGVDGLLARSRDDWARHLAALAGSPALRHDPAGAARERLLAEYTAERRAAYGPPPTATRRPASGRCRHEPVSPQRSPDPEPGPPPAGDTSRGQGVLP